MLFEESYLALPYSGSSMEGTFAYGDVLLVLPVAYNIVRVGDVIAARRPRMNPTKALVVHRVQGRKNGALITRGDTCLAPDSTAVLSADLVGRVVLVQRDGKVRPVLGGRRGQLWAQWLRLRRCLMALGRLPYRLLRGSGIGRRFWWPDVVRICIETEQGVIVKYVHRGRTIARWWPGEDLFWCRKPYDLVIDNPLWD